MGLGQRFGVVGLAVLLVMRLMVPALGVEPSELMVMDPEVLTEPPWERVAEPPESTSEVTVAPDPAYSVRQVAPVVELPDRDTNRTGLTRGTATLTALSSTDSRVGDLPVSLRTDSEAALSASVEILGEAAAAGVSPFGVALTVDLVGSGESTAATATASFDYSDLPLGYSAGVVDRLQLLWGSDCVEDSEGVLSCETLTVFLGWGVMTPGVSVNVEPTEPPMITTGGRGCGLITVFGVSPCGSFGTGIDSEGDRAGTGLKPGIGFPWQLSWTTRWYLGG